MQRTPGIMVVWGAVLASVGWSLDAHAYRPFDGTDADVAHLGEFELEAGPAYLVGRRITPSLALPSLVLNQGIFRGVELVVDAKDEVTLGGSGTAPTARLVDTDVQLKYLVRPGSLQGETGPSIATEFGPLLPTLGAERTWGADANIIMSEHVGSLTFHLNGGVALTRAATLELVDSLIAEGPSAWRIRPVSELLVEHELGGSTMYSVLVGSIWPAADNLVFDIGARGAVLDGEPVAELRAGLTWTLPVWTVRTSATPVAARL
jgi:hypothetical protein